jgi:hypothetical protein
LLERVLEHAARVYARRGPDTALTTPRKGPRPTPAPPSTPPGAFDSNAGNWIYNYKLREQTSSVEEFGILPARRRMI